MAPSKLEREKYLKKLGKILKSKGIETTKWYLEKIPRNTKIKEKEYDKLFTYLANNEHMLDYPNYLKNNYLIGSGAIESAHRTVLQRRMKQSGQRWSERGLKNMINLRVLYMSGYKNQIRDLICGKMAA